MLLIYIILQPLFPPNDLTFLSILLFLLFLGNDSDLTFLSILLFLLLLFLGNVLYLHYLKYLEYSSEVINSFHFKRISSTIK